MDNRPIPIGLQRVPPDVQEALFASAGLDDSNNPPISKEQKERYAKYRKSGDAISKLGDIHGQE